MPASGWRPGRRPALTRYLIERTFTLEVEDEDLSAAERHARTLPTMAFLAGTVQTRVVGRYVPEEGDEGEEEDPDATV